MNEFSFPEKSRLKKQKKFEFIFDNGKKTATRDLKMWHVLSDTSLNALPKEPSKNAKLGLVISKKLGNAVRRNRVKRLLREVFRLNRHKLKDGARLIIYPLKGRGIDTFSEMAEEMRKLCRKAGILK